MSDQTAMLAAILLASSRNASYDATAAVKDAKAIQSAIAADGWLTQTERALGLPANGCAEVDDAA